jgi:hypothetical protein
MLKNFSRDEGKKSIGVQCKKGSKKEQCGIYKGIVLFCHVLEGCQQGGIISP